MVNIYTFEGKFLILNKPILLSTSKYPGYVIRVQPKLFRTCDVGGWYVFVECDWPNETGLFSVPLVNNKFVDVVADLRGLIDDYSSRIDEDNYKIYKALWDARYKFGSVRVNKVLP